MITSYKSVPPTASPHVSADDCANAAIIYGLAMGNAWALMRRPYPVRKVVSLSLARTQRILELHQRIAAKLRALPEAEWQRAQNLAINRRADLVHQIRDLEQKITKAPRFSMFLELKNKLHSFNDQLCLFDRNMNDKDVRAADGVRSPFRNFA